jgi:site-specific DNA-methyltransferase (adenine-specific)
MDGEKVDLYLTDPPYNVAVGSCERPNSSHNNVSIMNDNMTEDDFVQFLTSTFRASSEAMNNGAVFYIFYAGLNHTPFDLAIRNVPTLYIHEQLVWIKSHFVLGRNSDYQWAHEPIIYGWRKGAKHYFIDSRAESTAIEEPGSKLSTMKKGDLIELCRKLLGEKQSSSVIRADKPSSADLHPTVKPQFILAEFIRNSSRGGAKCAGLIRWKRFDTNCLRANEPQVLHDGIGSALLRRNPQALGGVHARRGVRLASAHAMRGKCAAQSCKSC